MVHKKEQEQGTYGSFHLPTNLDLMFNTKEGLEDVIGPMEKYCNYKNDLTGIVTRFLESKWGKGKYCQNW